MKPRDERVDAVGSALQLRLDRAVRGVPHPPADAELVGPLPRTLAEAGISSVDPWGRPYVYLRAADASRSQLRKDGRLIPLNTDFDLYSYGPDGVSALALPAAPSRDDVVRAANGAYIGLGANY